MENTVTNNYKIFEAIEHYIVFNSKHCYCNIFGKKIQNKIIF